MRTVYTDLTNARKDVENGWLKPAVDLFFQFKSGGVENKTQSAGLRRRVRGVLLPWMNTKINEAMQDRDYHHCKAIRLNSSFHWTKYRRLRNLVNREIKSAKTNYYCDLIKEAKGDSNKLWTAVNEASSRTVKSSSPQCIIADGAHYTSPRSIASALNSHFASIGKILADKIRPVAPVSMSVANHSGSFQLKETSEAVVLKQ